MTQPSVGGAALELSPWELAAGIAIGESTTAITLPVARRQPQAALADAILPALTRPPCVVSFSGGRDSSAILAAATDVAHRHGLAPPVPVSLRFPGVASTAESEWQELVVAHLELEEWERVEIRGELDFLGDIACRGLRSHGLLWPANAHVHTPIFERARGGSVLTGLDGDGLFGWRRDWLWRALRQPGSLRPRDALRGGLALAPPSVRAARYRGSPLPGISWLRPAAERRVRHLLAAARASEPLRWDRRVAWYARRRYLQLGVHSLALLASDHGVHVAHPLLDPGFLTALAAAGGRAGLGDREAAMRRVFAELLPEALIARPTKAEFGGALWGPRARSFAATWDGGGVDRGLVDGDALRASWEQGNPPLASATLMQAAWVSGAR